MPKIVGIHTVQIPIASDWVSYTPTITTATGTITNTAAQGWWRRVGDTINIQFRLVCSGASGTWSGPRITIPSGLAIDFAKMSPNFGSTIGNVVFVNSGDNTYMHGKATFFSSTVISIAYTTNASGAGSSVTQAAPIAFDNGDVIEGNVFFPIVSWTSFV